MSIKYPDTQLFLNGEWRDALAKESLEIINPATDQKSFVKQLIL